MAMILPNDFLTFNSFLIFGAQSLILISYLLKRLKYLKNFFAPSFFIICYYLINQTLGSFLVPRGYGFNNWFEEYLVKIQNYNLIVAYLIVCNFLLFLVCLRTLKKLALFEPRANFEFGKTKIWANILDVLKISFGAVLFLIISIANVFSLFSFQLSIILIVCSSLAHNKRTIRYLAYFVFLLLMIRFNFDNKREVVISLFSMIFLESYYSRIQLQFSIKKLVIYISVICLFFSVIITSSILRGYGGFGADNFLTAVSYLPDYVESEIFIDGITDNLELNYSYGTSITAMNMIIEKDLPYQYGFTLMKLFFLPIPRSFISFKPESIMQMFTKKFHPTFWAEGGSLPVIVPVDMFLNFHCFGVFATGFLVFLVDLLFIEFHLLKRRNIFYFSFLFLFITVLAFARGSGIDLYIFYFIVSLPFLVFYYLVRIVISPLSNKNFLKI